MNSSSLQSRTHMNKWNQFMYKADKFMRYTSHYALQEDISPGGHYSAIWLRDAAYILKDHFLAGNTVLGVLEQMLLIWSHQILAGHKEAIVYGRGSPETNFKPQTANMDELSDTFSSALPTTIRRDFSEIYGLNPDIDSTALMVSSTSWILSKLLNEELAAKAKNIASSTDTTNSIGGLLLKRNASLSASDFLAKVINYLIPRMLNAVEYLRSRDIDNDDLLEQQYNEDWMDTALRAGKIVYSQGSWILALSSLSDLLSKLGRVQEAENLAMLISRTINGVEELLWSEDDGCYMDVLNNRNKQEQQENPNSSPFSRTLTQDVSLYLVAISENMIKDDNNSSNYNDFLCSRGGVSQELVSNSDYRAIKIFQRSIKTLDTLKSRIWKNQWPLVTEDVLRTTGPWNLRPNQYHNYTFWPWITAIEMLARSRFSRFEECHILLSKLATKRQPCISSFYEWIDPNTGQGNGAFPFRTGISAVRVAISDLLTNNINNNNNNDRSS